MIMMMMVVMGVVEVKTMMMMMIIVVGMIFSIGHPQTVPRRLSDSGRGEENRGFVQGDRGQERREKRTRSKAHLPRFSSCCCQKNLEDGGASHAGKRQEQVHHYILNLLHLLYQLHLLHLQRPLNLLPILHLHPPHYQEPGKAERAGVRRWSPLWPNHPGAGGRAAQQTGHASSCCSRSSPCFAS